MKKIKNIRLDYFLLVALAAIILGHYLNITPDKLDDPLLIFFASVATFPILVSAYKSLRDKKISVDLLASVALIVSLIHKEWASAVFINLMLTSARIFTAYTQKRSESAIKSLLKLRPEKVKIKKGAEIIEESVSKIKKGDLIVIESGDRIPVDGRVISGQAEIDQSSLTGESIPVSKKGGDRVFSSTLNASGSLIIQAERVGKNTTFEKIIQLVEQSQNNKIGIQTLADKFTRWYIIATIIGTIALYIFVRDLNLVLAVLLVTCADDIAVAIPMAFSAAIGKAAKSGIIIKGGEFFEGLTKVKTFLVDKTGTITKGKLEIKSVFPLGDLDSEKIIKLAATGSCFSQHPVAKAIINYAKIQKIDFEKPQEFKEISGMGSTALYENKTIICGRKKLLEQFNVEITREQQIKITEMEQEGNSVLLVSYAGRLSGYIKFADEVRPEAKEALAELKRLGVEKIIMLTGDNEKVAQKVANQLDIDSFYANLLPQDKLKYIKKYIRQGNGKTAMVGDGVNDAASLALSDVGIAMGAIGTDSAIEAADIALMKDDFSKIPAVVKLSFSVNKIAHQDFIIWGLVNVIGLTLAFTRTIGPEGAAAFNFVTDFFPIINSLRLFRYKFSKV